MNLQISKRNGSFLSFNEDNLLFTREVNATRGQNVKGKVDQMID